jgi:hypothetical protein
MTEQVKRPDVETIGEMILGQTSEPSPVRAYAMEANHFRRAFGAPIVLMKSHLRARDSGEIKAASGFHALTELRLRSVPRFLISQEAIFGSVKDIREANSSTPGQPNEQRVQPGDA